MTARTPKQLNRSNVCAVSLKAIAVVLAAFVGAPLLAACGARATPGPSASASAASGIYGIALLGPGGSQTSNPTPSPLPGGFGSSEGLKPFAQATVLIKARDGEHAGQVVARVKSDNQGIFRVALPPGRYLLMGQAHNSERKQVTVQAGGYTRTRITVVFFH
jgi:hypothetical protein